MTQQRVQEAENHIVTAVPQVLLASQDWWNKLDEKLQVEVKTEADQLTAAMMANAFSRLGIGEHLTKAQDLLKEKHGAFTAFLRTFSFSRASAYVYINGYAAAKERLPETVLKVAMARGMNLLSGKPDRPLGVYTEAIKQMPPPKTENVEKVSEYLDKIEEKRRVNKATADEQEEPAVAPEVLLKECVRFVRLRIGQIPARKKGRWGQSLIGMLMTELGISNAQSLTPEAIPEAFRKGPGRPSKAA